MELKHQEGELSSKRKHYLGLKLQKAVKWADELTRVAGVRLFLFLPPFSLITHTTD
jgi:hypothetical protein